MFQIVHAYGITVKAFMNKMVAPFGFVTRTSHTCEPNDSSPITFTVTASVDEFRYWTFVAWDATPCPPSKETTAPGENPEPVMVIFTVVPASAVIGVTVCTPRVDVLVTPAVMGVMVLVAVLVNTGLGEPSVLVEVGVGDTRVGDRAVIVSVKVGVLVTGVEVGSVAVGVAVIKIGLPSSRHPRSGAAPT